MLRGGTQVASLESRRFSCRPRNLSPEHAVENVSVRLHEDAVLRHLVFLDAQDLTERIHLPAHVLHHLVDGIDLDIAALITVEANLIAMLSAAFIKSGVSLPSAVLFRKLARPDFEQLGEIDFGAFGRLAELDLQIVLGGIGSCIAWPNG